MGKAPKPAKKLSIEILQFNQTLSNPLQSNKILKLGKAPNTYAYPYVTLTSNYIPYGPI
jgi:hypothetical protein